MIDKIQMWTITAAAVFVIIYGVAHFSEITTKFYHVANIG